MSTLTYYGRGLSGTANNAVLNVQNVNTTATTELVFSSGVSGDLVLDHNSGGFDPDTTVFVNGVERHFSVNFIGNLQNDNQLKNVNGLDLRGAEVVVITIDSGQSFFFLVNPAVSQASMNAFPNGARDLDGFDPVSDVLLCFVRGTLIRTPMGEQRVEDLRPGDYVLNADGDAVPLLWRSSRHLDFPELLADPSVRPVCIPRDFLGRGMPYRDLWVSPQHRILFRGWESELLFRDREVLVPAKHLVDAWNSPSADITAGVEYFHLFFGRHEILVSNGLESESLYPGDMAVTSFSEADRAEFENIFAAFGPDWLGYGPTARATITGKEAAVLRNVAGLGRHGQPQAA
jgi:hypothetical protein